MGPRPRKRKKNPSGQGGVHERKDGRFDAYLTIRTLDGPRKQVRTTKSSRAEAYRWLNKKRHERDEGILPSIEAERITVGEYLERWLDTVRDTVSRHTFKDYEGKVRLHLQPTLGSIKLKDLGAADLQRLYSKLLKTHSPRSVEYVHVTISKALNQAEAWDLVRKNVARHAKPPKKKHSEKRTLDAEQIRKFFGAAKEDRFYALYILALTTGLRRGELLGIKWRDVGLERATLRVQRSLDYLYGPPTENAPKRESSKRSVKLMPEAVAALEEHRVSQLHQRLRAGPRWQENGYVFPSSRGTPMSGDNLLKRNLRPLLEKAGLPPLTFHELRHTFATLMLSRGEHMKVVQSILGHASIVQTMDTYSHVSKQMGEDAAEGLRGYLFGE